MWIRLKLFLFNVYCFVFRPELQGVAVQAFSPDGSQVLLVRKTYRDTGWEPVAGHCKRWWRRRRERTVDAAVREMREEVGLKADNLQYHGSFVQTRKWHRLEIFYFSCVALGEIRPQKSEIRMAAWFDLDYLPSQITRASQDFIVRCEVDRGDYLPVRRLAEVAA